MFARLKRSLSRQRSVTDADENDHRDENDNRDEDEDDDDDDDDEDEEDDVAYVDDDDEEEEDVGIVPALVTFNGVCKIGTVWFDYPAYLKMESRLVSTEPSLHPVVFGSGREGPTVRPEMIQVSESSASLSARIIEEGIGDLSEMPVLRFRIHGSNRYHAVANGLLRAGFIETNERWGWNILWSKHLDFDSYGRLRWYQKVNHFPGSTCIGNKARLVRTIEKLRQDTKAFAEFAFLPESYVLPSDRKIMELKLRDCAKGTIWIVKPCNASCGRGIRLTTNPSDLSEKRKAVVCRYVPNPMLINGRKYDMRIYVLVTSYRPLRAYVYREGLVRFATAKYTTDPKSLTDTYRHLTNYSVNKKAANFTTEAKTAEESSKWRLTALRTWMDEQGMNSKKMLRSIHDMMTKTLIAAEPRVGSLTRSYHVSPDACFELYGFDVLLDEEMKPWLIEVNTQPSFSSSSPLDKQIKVRLLADTLHLVGLRNIDVKTEMAREQRAARKMSSSSSSNAMAVNAKTLSVLAESDLQSSDLYHLRVFASEQLRIGNFQLLYPTVKRCTKFDKYFLVSHRVNVALRTFIKLSPEKQTRILNCKFGYKPADADGGSARDRRRSRTGSMSSRR